MWTPYKELLSIVEIVIGHNKVEYISDLEKYLVTYRPAVIALLENPVRLNSHIRYKYMFVYKKMIYN